MSFQLLILLSFFTIMSSTSKTMGLLFFLSPLINSSIGTIYSGIYPPPSQSTHMYPNLVSFPSRINILSTVSKTFILTIKTPRNILYAFQWRLIYQYVLLAIKKSSTHYLHCSFANKLFLRYSMLYFIIASYVLCSNPVIIFYLCIYADNLRMDAWGRLWSMPVIPAMPHWGWKIA